MSAFAAVSEVYRYRDLFWSLTWRELRARYKGSALGFAWSVLNPLLMLAVYTAVFTHVLRLGMPNFSVFLFCGLLPWTWFSTSVSHSATCILANAGLVKKVYFPLELLPTIMVTSNMVNYVLSLPVHCTAIGATTIGQLEDDVRIAQQFKPLSGEEMEALRQRAARMRG
ncbi:MAG: ABC transporter permease, partial [Candidatus Sericytochromatia bacterium]